MPAFGWPTSREFCLLRRDVPGTTAVLRTDSLSARPRGTDYREGCCSYELVQFFAGRHYDHRDDNAIDIHRFAARQIGVYLEAS